MSRSGLNAHRHHDVLVVVAAGHRDERAGVGVAKCEAYALASQILQSIQQIGDVEADIKAFALIRNFELLLGLWVAANGLNTMS